MSALAGIMYFDGRTPDVGDLDRLARGLPNFGVASATVLRADAVGLVYRNYPITREDRLERQPMTGAGGRYRLVFAGSLDNRSEIAGALSIPPSRLSEMPDGAICLAALETWGEGAPTRLFGAYAYALWDDRERRLSLCRDRGGRRSMFYHVARDFVAFGSTPQALLALPNVPRELDQTIVGDLVALNFSESRRTIYRGIERVPSGAVASFARDGTLIVERYWRPQRRDLGLRTHGDYVDAGREMLDRCVASALRSERPVAASVSGGLDSSGVAATAANQLAPGRLAVYSRVPPVGFAMEETETAYFDERPKVSALVKNHANMDLTLVDEASPHRFELDPNLAAMTFGIPLVSVVNIGWFASLYDRVSRDGHRVLLGGMGGNFSLGWHSPGRIEHLLGKGRFVRAFRETLAYCGTTGRSLRSTVIHQHLFPLVPPALRRLRYRLSGRRIPIGREGAGFIDPAFDKVHGLTERLRSAAGRPRAARGADSFDFRARALCEAGEAGNDGRNLTLDIYGFEMRDPLVDPRMIEFCLNVPEEHFNRDGRPRALQRDVIADRVPAQIHANYKFGHQAPEWLDRLNAQRGAILDDIDRIGRSPLASSMIDMKRLRAAAGNWPTSADEARSRQLDICSRMMRALSVGQFICWFEGRNN